ncbi:PAS sensor protein [Paenibacillus sp. P3E]|uniref:helix-turn-helix transcriptional regulator n=1 Tax=Paenibacillus sp. P3E TaxID=1349435 RepID=UPI00093C820F|nr:AAA family ATPase [Paenibacillus sp. P3E]OKP73648.1 PAS sensor protein [Paenibacillus sp. P3E]
MKVNQQSDIVIRNSTLREWMNGQTRMNPEAFLTLARSIVACVLQLHQLQILHLDLRPERIGVRSNGQEAYLIDSGYALHRSDHGYLRPAGYGISDAGLAYCSPENTGRMLRTVDERSDLYSVGIIFYELLAGHLPFLADNPLEWVYMHLAQVPPPLTQDQTYLPEGLEAVVMRLLDKNPDNRYQNAGFLLADLDKVGRSHDTFFMEPGFHGREYEISMLTQAFYSACFGSTEMVYVSGEAGIGKTSLMDEVFRKQQHARSFFYVTGKFEQISKESPYHPIIQAFRGLMRHLLGERKEQSELWRQKLQEALGASANVITAIIPEAELILGTLPSVEELPANESKKRFIYVFRRFVQALASKEHPLVLFIDDLQWADSSSLQLIHALLCDPECQYLMFVCAYRHNDIDLSSLPGYEHDGSVTDQAAIRHIHLSPLSLEQMNDITIETLNTQADTALSFTELLYHKSNGNPFHFKQILLRLQDDSILVYNHENRCWQWDLGSVIGQEPSYAINDLMEHRLRRLPVTAQELLQISACVGSTFHPDLIACVANREIGDVMSEWPQIEAEGMIVADEAGTFRFAHDNIHKLIYSQIDDDTKQAIHSSIGRALNREASGYEENLFDVVNHLNRGSGRMTGEAEILQLIQLNLDAGNRAKATSAYDVALGYFRKGVELLPAEAWSNTFELCFELHAEQAECEYLCGNAVESDRKIDFLLLRARNAAERSRVQMIRIMQYINQGKYLEGTALGLESLREHHVNISPNPGKFELIVEALRIDVLLHNRYDRLAHLEEMSDKDRIAVMHLILAITPSTFFTNKEVFFLLMCRAIQLSIKYGNTPVSAAVYSAYSMLLGYARGKFDKGYAIGKVGIELSERYNITSVKSKSYTMFGGVLCQFAGNAREGDAYLAKALRFGMESGDYVFASYAMGAHINSLYTRAPLSEFSRTITEYMVFLDTTNDEFVKQNFYLYQQFILALQGRTLSPDSFSSTGFEEEEFLGRIHMEETSATTLFQYSTYKTQLSYLLGNYEEAIRWASQAKPYEAYATHLPHLPECLMYESLALLADSVQPGKRAHLKKRFNRNFLRFKKWAAWSPANYRSRYYLLQAEHARASGKGILAEELYDKTIREAREQGDVQVTSLAGELAARYYRNLDKGKTALFYLQLALEAFTQWGVQIKIKQLEDLLLCWQRGEHADESFEIIPIPADRSDVELSGEAAGGAHHETHALDGLDLAAILKTTQMITNQMDSDTVLAEIMNTIMKYAGASKGALLMDNKDGLNIQAYADSEAQTSLSPSELNDSLLLPEGIIRYVFRTQEHVHYVGGEESWLIHNPYIAKHRPGSALCIPVTVHGNMLGVLYLENKLASGVFAYDRLTVLQAMASNGILFCMLQNTAGQSNKDPEAEEASLSAIMEEPLTERELEVLSLLAAGLSNKEIADQLVIAIGTVKVHVKNIFAKLKVNRRTKAIIQAKELNLLTRP